jgi:hypothetical protein
MKNFTARELAMIASIDGALVKETNPELVVLLRTLKEGHQDAHGQLTALARLEHRPTAKPWPLASMVMQLEGWLARSWGAQLTLDVLRNLEHKFETAYIEARDLSDGKRFEVLDRLAKRASARLYVLANRSKRTCMRCLLDRPGTETPLLREYPHIYVCSACHGEVRSSFPPDIRSQLDAWPRHVRDARIIERALGRSSKQRAKDEVHTVLAGQLPIVGPKGVKPAKREEQRTGGPVEGRESNLVVTATDSEHEAAYTEWLFDYRSIRARW